MKIVVLDGYLANFDRMPWKLAEYFPDMEWHDHTPPDQVAARIGDAEAVFANRAMLSGRVLEQCPGLRFIGVFGTGYNIVDLAAADRLGITVCNVPGYSARAVAQHTAALLLAVANKTAGFDRLVKSGGWKLPADPAVTAIPMTELAGKTAGILGWGAIGRAFGEICLALGMRVLACRRNPDFSEERENLRFADLDTLRRDSDVLSIHCPLTEETRGMVDRRFLAGMKPGAILLNTARGAILDEEGAADALDSGRLAGAGVDVFEAEPAGAENPLARHPKCVATPHVSWAARETRARLLEACADNFLAFLEGKPRNVVNHPAPRT